MVNSFSIKNFRSFNEVKVEGCKRINLIVGDNGSGKTALLEALFLAAGVSPELLLRTRLWRGHDPSNLVGGDEDLHAVLWHDLFHNFNIRRSAVISLKGMEEHTRSVTVSVNPPGHKKVVPPGRGQPQGSAAVVPVSNPIEFKWDVGISGTETIKPFFQNGRLIIPAATGKYVKAAFFAANQTPSSVETAGRFSGLSIHMQEDAFIFKMADLFPQMKDISIEIAGGIPGLYAHIRNIDRKIPVPLASGGANKLSAILLGIAQYKNGIVIIDEIENGLYFGKLEKIWETIFEFTKFYNCQVFASTHSLECLRAAAVAAGGKEDDFCILQASMEDGETRVNRISGETFVSAVHEDFELR